MQIFQTACRFSMPVRMFVLMLMRRTFQAIHRRGRAHGFRFEW